jgi:cytochrome c553
MKILKWGAAVVLILLVIGVAGFGYASHVAAQKLDRTIETHAVDFLIPWPLSEAEIAEIREERLKQWREDHPDDGGQVDESGFAPHEEFDALAGVDLDAVALERARARGKHLVMARYACVECHGKDFSGGVMIDDPAIGRLLGPNLTAGKGSVTTDYTAADWDRILRHGVTKKGKPTIMPSVDFLLMSDQEISDIVSFIQSMPAVDNEVPPVSLGPVGKILLATGQLLVTADLTAHHVEHSKIPPQAAANVEFGQHIAQVCAGCHGMDFTGGPIVGGAPDWPAAYNLTSHQDGLGPWSLEEFETVLRTGKGRSGALVRSPMKEFATYGQNLTATEIEAMFNFFQSLSPKPTR